MGFSRGSFLDSVPIEFEDCEDTVKYNDVVFVTPPAAGEKPERMVPGSLRGRCQCIKDMSCVTHTTYIRLIQSEVVRRNMNGEMVGILGEFLLIQSRGEY